jgi:hypothetical protein
MSSELITDMSQITSSWAERPLLLTRLELQSPQPSVSLSLYFLVILPNLIEYLLLDASDYILQLHFIIINMEPAACQVRNHYSQKNQEVHPERALARALKKTANLHC